MEVILGALLLSLILFAFTRVPVLNVNLNLGDEGYLWLGSILTSEGKIPIRDFRAYDPGRYYYCALWLRCFGPGLITIRLAMMFMMYLGLVLVALTIYHETRSWPVTIVAAILSFAWMWPPHKSFEIFFSILVVFAGINVLSGLGLLTALLTGLCVGIAGLVGLNIGLYAGVSLTFILLAAWLEPNYGIPIWHILLYLSGIGLGVLPFVAMLIFVEGFAVSYWDRKILTIIRRGTTNLHLPLPWLWATHTPQLSGYTPVRRYFFKFLFTTIPLFYAYILIDYMLGGASEKHLSGPVVVSSHVGTVYLHHLFSRADAGHLFQTIQPFIISLAFWLTSTIPMPWAVAAIVIISVISVWTIAPGFEDWFNRITSRATYSRFESGKTKLRLPRRQASWLTDVKRLVSKYSQPGQPVVFLPTLVTLYPLFDRQPAVYDIYSVYPASEDTQKAMIASIERSKTHLAIINNSALDGRDDLRFSKTHPDVWTFIRKNFNKIQKEGMPANIVIFIRNS